MDDEAAEVNRTTSADLGPLNPGWLNPGLDDEGELFVCTYITANVQAQGSAKGPDGWFAITDASVYFDHPVHAQLGHSLNIDLRNPTLGPAARVAAELTAESARALALAILEILDGVPAGLT